MDGGVYACLYSRHVAMALIKKNPNPRLVCYLALSFLPLEAFGTTLSD